MEDKLLQKENESKNWPSKIFYQLQEVLYYSLLYYGSGVKRPFWPHSGWQQNQQFFPLWKSQASWSRAGLAMVPFFSGSTLPNPSCYLVVSGCWAQQLQIKSTANRRFDDLTSHPPLSSFKLCYGFYVRENQRPLLEAFPVRSGHETWIQRALQHFQHCFLIPSAWSLRFGEWTAELEWFGLIIHKSSDCVRDHR